MHFDIGVLYIRNVRYLGLRGLKVGVGDVLLKGLYCLDGWFRPRGLSSIDCSIKGLIRARHMLLRSGMGHNAPLQPRWGRKHNGRGGRRGQ